MTTQDNRYKVGQIWEYETRNGEEESTLTIVGVEKHRKLGAIVNIYVGGLKLKNPNSDNGLSGEIQHLPFSKDAMDKSVTRLISTTLTLPDYSDGYNEWRSAFDMGKAGVFSITVKESIDVTEKTISQ